VNALRITGVAATAGVLALAGAAALAAGTPKNTVIMDGVKYEPPMLTVKRGTTVSFVNKDPFPHTVTSAGHFDSKEIAANKTWKYKATKAGRFDYICTLHPNMKGTLVVE
jgi:plastocyanin